MLVNRPQILALYANKLTHWGIFPLLHTIDGTASTKTHKNKKKTENWLPTFIPITLCVKNYIDIYIDNEFIITQWFPKFKSVDVEFKFSSSGQYLSTTGMEYNLNQHSGKKKSDTWTQLRSTPRTQIHVVALSFKINRAGFRHSESSTLNPERPEL